MQGMAYPPTPNTGVTRTLWKLTGADMNSVADQAFVKQFGFTQYRITGIWITNASATLAATLKTLAVRTATGGGGTAIVNAQNLTALITSANMLVCTLLNSDVRSDAALYALLSAGTGVAATCDIYIDGIALS